MVSKGELELQSLQLLAKKTIEVVCMLYEFDIVEMKKKTKKTQAVPDSRSLYMTAKNT